MNTPETDLFPQEGGTERQRLEEEQNQEEARAKLWLWVGGFVVVIGALTLLVQASDILGELHARATWTRVTGFVDAAKLRDAAQRDSPGNATGSRTFYWAEFEVSFQPARDCGERRTVQDAATGMLSCQANIISHPDGGPSDAERWLNRHGPGRQAELLYDPNGTGVKFADESLVNLVEWKKVFLGLLLLGIGGGLVLIARRQVREFAREGKGAGAI